jgi:hypothetical protein
MKLETTMRGTPMNGLNIFGLCFLCLITAAAPAYPFPEWFQGTGSESAYDKKIAHDIAYQYAVEAATKYCVNVGTIVEEKVDYDQLPDKEWRAQVTVRVQCDNESGGDRM